MADPLPNQVFAGSEAREGPRAAGELGRRQPGLARESGNGKRACTALAQQAQDPIIALVDRGRMGFPPELKHHLKGGQLHLPEAESIAPFVDGGAMVGELEKEAHAMDFACREAPDQLRRPCPPRHGKEMDGEINERLVG